MPPGPAKQFDPDVALEKAMDVFWAHGYEAASLSQLLDAMGIGRKSLYDTFGTKRDLFLKALDHYGRTQVRQIRNELRAPGSPLGNLRRVLENFEASHCQHRPGCMLATNVANFTQNDEEVAAALRRHLESLTEAFAATLQRAQAEGELREDQDPTDTARLLLCATQGMALLSRVMGHGQLHRSARGALMQLLSAE
jgi:TetR/AcrR family transcriptional repressor of nem operon